MTLQYIQNHYYVTIIISNILIPRHDFPPFKWVLLFLKQKIIQPSCLTLRKKNILNKTLIPNKLNVNVAVYMYIQLQLTLTSQGTSLTVERLGVTGVAGLELIPEVDCADN